MKILVTGSNGFIAKNLIAHLNRNKKLELYFYKKNDSMDLLEAYVKEADFIFHLAGVNRPSDKHDFYKGNKDLTQYIVNVLMQNDKSTPVLFSSSIQAIEDNDYGKSKKAAEGILVSYQNTTDAHIFIYRLPNVFGKWSKANYNSVVATWCSNIANNLEIQVSNRNVELALVYIDDVIKSFIERLTIHTNAQLFEINTVYKKTLGQIEELLYKFKENRNTLLIPNVASEFERALYATYLSYLPTNQFSYPLNGHTDDRGTFYEIIKTLDSGQFSLSTTAPGIKRGSHYHHTKNEKFLVVRGEALIEFRHILNDEVISYKVSDKKMEVIEMIPGYTHNIKNIGDEEMILFLWANENYNHENPDTYFLEV